MKFSNKEIQNIADFLGSGMKCYINKAPKEIKFIYDLDDAYGDTEMWEEELEELERTWKDYIVIEKMRSRDSYHVMESFVYTVKDEKIQEQLVRAINRRSPFRNFKEELYAFEEVQQRWYKYRDRKYQEYVRDDLKLQLENVELEPAEEIVEQSQEITEKQINFKGKSFKIIANSSGGKVNSDTVFEFDQKEDLVSAQYYGGGIKSGHILGTLEEKQLNLLYHCITESNELKTGQAVAEVSFNSEGKMKLMMKWQWLNGSQESGVSEYLEE